MVERPDNGGSSEHDTDTSSNQGNLAYVDKAASKLVFGELSAGELRVLATINQKIAAAPSLEALLDYLFEAAREIFPCDRLGIAFLEDGERLVSHYVVTSYEPVLLGGGYAEDVNGSSLSAVLRHGTPRIINDLPAYLDSKPHSRSTRLLVEEGVRSSMTCPLHLDGEVVGVLFRSSRKAGAYSERDARKHQAIAERLGQAVEKTYRLHQLQETRRAYDKLLGFVTRDLRVPLTAMLLDAEKLLGDDLGPLSDEQRQRLESLSGKGEQLLEQLKDYSDLALLEGGRVELRIDEHVDLQHDVLETVLAMHRTTLDDRGMSVELHLPEDDVIAECDPDLLRLAVGNLVTNAIKYGERGGHLRVGLEREEQGGAFSIAVWNEGQGFDKAARGRLFRRFSRLPEAARREGTGLGLYTCWRVVRLHGGRIDARSEAGSWAEFRFTIPQPLPAELRQL